MCDLEHDDADHEPSLGSLDGQIFQERWADGRRDDVEGDVLDEPHDPELGDEPTLGATEDIDQRAAWSEDHEGLWLGTDLEGPDDDLEPSLGSGHPDPWCIGALNPKVNATPGLNGVDQTFWANGSHDDREHNGGENNAEHDGAEPEAGS